MVDTTGILYLCATPIGNLEDMTYRAVRVLQEVDVIAAEDTRHTRKLLSHFQIHTPLVSYHAHNKQQMGEYLLERLLAGENIAVVSDAGMPGISDPGMELVRLAIDHKIQVIPVPGANAALSALVCSGFDTTVFTFIGFLPKTTAKRQETLGAFRTCPYTMIIYESPHRLMAVLQEMLKVWGNRQIVAGREITKKFEEFVRGDITGLLEHFTQNPPRGEFTLVIHGFTGSEEESEIMEQIPLAQAVDKLVHAGIDKKEAIRQIAVERKVSRRSVYQEYLVWDKKK